MGKNERKRKKKQEKQHSKQLKRVEKVSRSLGRDVSRAYKLAKAGNQPVNVVKPDAGKKAVYRASHCTLVVGDGDFSFSRGLLQHRKSGAGLTVTSFDSQSALVAKYGSKAEACIKACKKGGAAVMHGVDATKLTKHFPGHSFQRIVFNFPHTGQQRVHVNRALLSGFFSAAERVLAQGGEVHMALKLQPPYNQWGAEDLAQAAGFVHYDTLAFDPADFPGYHHQTTCEGAKSLDTESRGARKNLKTLVFRRKAGYAPAPSASKEPAVAASIAAALLQTISKESDSD